MLMMVVTDSVVIVIITSTATTIIITTSTSRLSSLIYFHIIITRSCIGAQNPLQLFTGGEKRRFIHVCARLNRGCVVNLIAGKRKSTFYA